MMEVPDWLWCFWWPCVRSQPMQVCPQTKVDKQTKLSHIAYINSGRQHGSIPALKSYLQFPHRQTVIFFFFFISQQNLSISLKVIILPEDVLAGM